MSEYESFIRHDVSLILDEYVIIRMIVESDLEPFIIFKS